MPKRKSGGLRISKARVDEPLRTIYRKLREEFTAADLAKFTEIEEGIPFERVLADLEKIHQKNEAKPRRRKLKSQALAGSLSRYSDGKPLKGARAKVQKRVARAAAKEGR